MGLDALEIVLWAEDEFGVDLPDQITRDLRTVGELVGCIGTRQSASAAGRPLTGSEIHDRLAGLLASRFGLPRERIARDARFAADLNID
jgi:acyl carrier protein